MGRHGWPGHVWALVAYVLVALAFSWPLPLHLATHLTGPPDSDTGVYVWNQWVFRHEIVEHRTLPYFTGAIFSLTSRANLSLHNYTTFANVLALPLMGIFGVVATFNIVYLVMTVLTAYAMFLLARHLTSGADVESWLAGFLFSWCPMLVTRGAGHFSLVAAAPLPVFLLLLLRAQSTQRMRDAVALGLCAAWAASTDVYYAVFCLMLAAGYLGARLVGIRRRAASPANSMEKAAIWATDVLIVCVAGLVLALAVSSGWRFTFLGRLVSIRSLYTPVLVLTVLVLLRVGWRYRPALRLDRAQVWRVARLAFGAAVAAAVVLSPVLYAVGVRIAEGRFAVPATWWRSSPRGVDMLSFVVPNPNHPLATEALRGWLTTAREGYLENVASIPFVALGMILAAWRIGWKPPRLWTSVGLTFGLLALGPFIHVAHMNTHVPTPWTVLRYAPIIGLARSPARFSVIVMIALAALFALALRALVARWPHRRRVLVACGAALLAFELLPAPRPLYSAAIPAIYERIASDPRKDIRVLELPFGVRDGASSVGNFRARAQFHQTFHHRPILGGYLSRVSRRRVAEVRASPMLTALIKLSEGRNVREHSRLALIKHGPQFVRRAHLGYVVIDRSRASPALVDFAIRALRLEWVAADRDLELYQPSLAAEPL
jgi:hypothetical protein